ncbi:unnamed protein product [Amoebophrya sp. A25]|nr:unnamed protein product [Amoebophrya sp. A25]|eukprot:GSA25T00011471001.1
MVITTGVHHSLLILVREVCLVAALNGPLVLGSSSKSDGASAASPSAASTVQVSLDEDQQEKAGAPRGFEALPRPPNGQPLSDRGRRGPPEEHPAEVAKRLLEAKRLTEERERKKVAENSDSQDTVPEKPGDGVANGDQVVALAQRPSVIPKLALTGLQDGQNNQQGREEQDRASEQEKTLAAFDEQQPDAKAKSATGFAGKEVEEAPTDADIYKAADGQLPQSGEHTEPAAGNQESAEEAAADQGEAGRAREHPPLDKQKVGPAEQPPDAGSSERVQERLPEATTDSEVEVKHGLGPQHVAQPTEKAEMPKAEAEGPRKEDTSTTTTTKNKNDGATQEQQPETNPDKAAQLENERAQSKELERRELDEASESGQPGEMTAQALPVGSSTRPGDEYAAVESAENEYKVQGKAETQGRDQDSTRGAATDWNPGIDTSESTPGSSSGGEDTLGSSVEGNESGSQEAAEDSESIAALPQKYYLHHQKRHPRGLLHRDEDYSDDEDGNDNVDTQEHSYPHHDDYNRQVQDGDEYNLHLGGRFPHHEEEHHQRKDENLFSPSGDGVCKKSERTPEAALDYVEALSSQADDAAWSAVDASVGVGLDIQRYYLTLLEAERTTRREMYHELTKDMGPTAKFIRETFRQARNVLVFDQNYGEEEATTS